MIKERFSLFSSNKLTHWLKKFWRSESAKAQPVAIDKKNQFVQEQLELEQKYRQAEALTTNERKRFINTVVEVAQNLAHQEVDYRLVGGFAVDLLADQLQVWPLNFYPGDIDIALERKGLSYFFDGPYQEPVDSNYLPVTSVNAASHESLLSTRHTINLVRIDVFMSPYSSEIPVNTTPLVLTIGGVNVKFLDPVDLATSLKQSIENFTKKGAAVLAKDKIRLEKSQLILEKLKKQS